MKNYNQGHAISATQSPRFCNARTFMRLPSVQATDNIDYAVIGVPFDTGSSYRTGSRFGPDAIRHISAMIKPNNIILNVNISEQLSGGDYGDIPVVPGYIQHSYDLIENSLQPIVDAGIIPICLGGDHSITLAELRAIARSYGPVALVQFDAHLDTVDEVFGEKYSHGTPFRRALEEGLIDTSHSIQIGIRGSLYDADDIKTSEELGFKVIPAHQVREIGLKETVRQIRERVGNRPAFCSFDIDFVDPAYAPGTGTPEAGGFTSWESLEMVRGISGINFVGFDIVEVLPVYDPAEITALLAANIGFEFISSIALKKSEQVSTDKGKVHLSVC